MDDPIKTAIEQHKRLEESSALGELIDVLPHIAIILNDCNHVVYLSKTAEKFFLIVEGEKSVIGQPIDAVWRDFLNSDLDGNDFPMETAKCHVKEIADEVQKQKKRVPWKVVALSEMSSGSRSGGFFYGYEASGAPLKIGEQFFSIIVLKERDTGKERRASERLFFHDILNTATGLKMYMDLFKRSSDIDERQGIIKRLLRINDTLADEIGTRHALSAAENGNLVVRHDTISSIELLKKNLDHFSIMYSLKGKKIVLRDDAEDIVFISDELLVRQGIMSLIETVLDAAGKDGTVTIGCRKKSISSGESKREGLAFTIQTHDSIDPDTKAVIFLSSVSSESENRETDIYRVKLFTEGYLDGDVSFTSNSENGMTFTVWYPL